MARPSEGRGVALVTGAAGFTGRYVSDLLSRSGYVVIPWGHHSGAGITAVDLTDRVGVNRALARCRPDLVFHLAGIAFVAHGDVDAIYRTNIVGTRNLLEAVANGPHMPRRILLASSANVYGNAEGSVGETAPLSPQNDYAVSKLAMEQTAGLWTELPVTVVRPFNYTGVGQSDKFLLPKIVAHFARRSPCIELGNIDVSRDFNDVRNVAAIYLRLAEASCGQGTFNVCSGVEHSLARVIELMQQIAGYEIRVEVNPNFVRRNEVKRLVGDPSRLVACIGELPQFELESTLQWMYEDARRNAYVT